MVRAGFTLVEVVVAVVVLSIGVLGTVAVGQLGSRLVREAHAAERAIAGAALVLDSLTQRGAPAAGERTLHGQHLRWTTRPEGGTVVIELVVEYGDGTARRRLVFGTRHIAAPPRLGGAP